MTDIVEEFGQWLHRHDLTVDLFVIWAVVVSAVVISAGLLFAWLILRGTKDQTNIGRTLKWQKLSLSIALMANGVYWSVVLFAFYTGHVVGIWEKTILRLVFAGGMLIGAVYVALFAHALWRAIHSSDPGPISLTEDGEQ